MLVRLLITGCFCITLSLLHAQPRYSVTHYTSENGLPANGMKGMVFDEQTGFLWIATEGGLLRFDGKKFIISPTKDSTRKFDDRMICLFQNRRNEIFGMAVTNRIYKIEKSAVVLYDSVAFRGYSYSPFALNVSEQLYKHKIYVERPYIYPLEGQTSIVPITDTSCLIKNNAALYYHSSRLDKPAPIPTNIQFNYPFKADGHFFLITLDHKLMEWDEKASTLQSRVFDFPFEANDRIYWQNGMTSPVLIADTAAYLIYYRQGKFQRELICTGIPRGHNIRHVLYNRDLGTVFVATASNGLFVIREQALSYMRRSPKNNSTTQAYYTQLVQPNGTILTREGHQFGELAYTAPPLIPPIPGKPANFGDYYFKDGDSVLYYTQELTVTGKPGPGTLRKYNYFTGKTTIFRSAESMPEKVAIERSGKNMYIATEKKLLIIGQDTLAPVGKPPFSSLGRPLTMKEIKPGVLAIGNCHTLITYAIASGKTDTVLTTTQSCIRTLFAYKGYMFVGCYGDGIYILKNGIIKPIPVDRNGYLQYAHCFVPDGKGYCWISSNKGLFKVLLADMIAAYHDKKISPYYQYFGREDGMTNIEMNGGCTPCAVWLPDSTISFPTMSGLLLVDPSKEKRGLQKKDIYLDQVKINDSVYHFTSLETRPLPAGTNNVFFELAIPVWENPENNYIKYRLDNHSEWKWISGNNSISLLNLGSGQHTLEIVKIDGFGQGNETRKLISFSIKMYWYESWWFIVLVFAGIIGLFYTGLIMRTRQIQVARKRLEKQIAEQTRELKEKNRRLEKKDAIQTRLISIINHDIITPLKFLSSTANKLIEKKLVIDDTTRDETLKEMTDTSRSLQLLAGDILNWIKYHNEGTKLRKEAFSLNLLIDNIWQLLKPIAVKKGIDPVIDIAPSIKIFQYHDPTKVLVYNLLMNAINFSENAPIIITAIQQDHEVILSIADKGPGMSMEQAAELLSEKSNHEIAASLNVKGKGYGLGYLIIRDILKLTGIRASVQSEPGVGTTVMLRIEGVANDPVSRIGH